jgi:hypothetical protein
MNEVILKRNIPPNLHLSHRRLSFSIPQKNGIAKDKNLTVWDRLYCANFNVTPRDVNEHAGEFLKRLMETAKNPAFFHIDIQDNPYLEREFESQVKAMITRGDAYAAERARQHKDKMMTQMAKDYGDKQFEQYKHIVDNIGRHPKDVAALCIILNEALTKVYKKTTHNGVTSEKPQIREPHKTLDGIMVLNPEIIEKICGNIGKYQNFERAYYDALDEWNNRITKQSAVSFNGVRTFDKGEWVKFLSKKSDEKNFFNNVQRLTALVNETPWCTKTLAGSQLSEGDFYVFVDKENKPHVAVKMAGNEIDEVRGVVNGNAQEIEPEYTDVVTEFLSKNKEIEGGVEWYDENERNKRLLKYREFAELKPRERDEMVKSEMVEQILGDVYALMKRAHGGMNSNQEWLKQHILLFEKQICEHFNCKRDQIYHGTFSHSDYEATEGIAVVLGNVNLNTVEFGKRLDELQYVTGNLYLYGVTTKSMEKLRYVGGNLDIDFNEGRLMRERACLNEDDVPISSLPALEYVGGDLSTRRAYSLNRDELTNNIPNLKFVGGEFNGKKWTREQKKPLLNRFIYRMLRPLKPYILE